MIFELAQDFRVTLAVMPKEYPRHRILSLLEEAIRRDIHFIARHPTTLFQCMWNACWWYDCPEAGRHYALPKDSNSSAAQHGLKLSTLLEEWKDSETCVKRPWLRAWLPPILRPGSAESAIFAGHQEAVWTAAISPDGSRVASGSVDCTVRVWSVESGLPLLVLYGHQWVVNSVTFSPCGRYLVSASSDQTVRCWSMTDGNLRWVFHGHRDRVVTVAYMLDGESVVSGSVDGTIRLLSAKNGRQLGIFHGHEGSVKAVACSPDSAKIASGSEDKTMRIWDVKTRQPLLVFNERYGSVHSVSFSLDGKQIAIGSLGGMVRVLDVASGEELAELHKGASPIHSLAISPDGHTIVLGCETAWLWRRPSVTEIPHELGVTSVSFFPEGDRILTASYDAKIRIWGMRTGDPFGPVKRKGPSALEYASDGKRILAHYRDDCSLRLLDSSNLTEMAYLGHGVQCTAFARYGDLMATGDTHDMVRVWDLVQGVELASRKETSGHPNSVSLSPDGAFLIHDAANTIRIWDLRTKSEATFLTEHADSIAAVSFSPDGTKIASASGESVGLWDFERRCRIVGFPKENAMATSLLFSSDGRFLACVAFEYPQQVLYLWDLQTGREAAVLRRIWDPKFSVDNRRIVAGVENTVQVWRLPEGTEVAKMEGHVNTVFSVACSSDGKRIASASLDSTIRIWDAERFECMEVLYGCGDLTAIAEGSRAFPFRAIGSKSETVIQMSKTGCPIFSLPTHFEFVATHPSGRAWAGADEHYAYAISLEAELPK